MTAPTGNIRERMIDAGMTSLGWDINPDEYTHLLRADVGEALDAMLAARDALGLSGTVGSFRYGPPNDEATS